MPDSDLIIHTHTHTTHSHNTHTQHSYMTLYVNISEYSDFFRKCARFNQLAVRIGIFFIIHEHLFLVFFKRFNDFGICEHLLPAKKKNYEKSVS